MKYRITSITEKSDYTPRVAILQSTDGCGNPFKCLLFRHVNNMISALGVSDDFSEMTDFVILLKEEQNRVLDEWETGMIVGFPF